MHTLLSVDIWDTVLRRRCHPDEVKLFTARALWTKRRETLLPQFRGPWRLVDARVSIESEIARSREDAGLDNEYTIEEVMERWLAKVLAPGVPGTERARLADRLIHAEVAQEQHVSYADAWMSRLLRTHDADRIIALSDFYIGERHLKKIIASACGPTPFRRVLVSADCRVNKMRGRLFAYAQREMLARPDRHTHIGDNEWSDVKSPKRFGIRAIHYHNPGEEALRLAHRTRLDARRTGDFVPTAQRLERELRRACEPPGDLDPRGRELFEIGFRAAPIYAGLVLGAMHEAHALGARAIHYCTREGEFFRRVHEAMTPVNPYGIEPPRAEVIEVSRLATFFPSLAEITTGEFKRLWGQYSTQSPAQMLKSLDVNPLPFEPIFRRNGIDADTEIDRPYEHPAIKRLFADPLFTRLLERQRDRRRALLTEYLRAKGLGTGPGVVVDIGWRGSIHDNICRLFPNRRIAGFYLALDHFKNPQPPNARKHAISIDARRDPETLMQIIYNVSPLEMLANTNTGSVRSYRRRTDGSLEAVRVHDATEDAVWEQFTRFFQEGVLAAAPLVARWFRTFAVDHREMKPMIVDILRALKTNPPRVLAEAYFSLRHNESFGVGGFVDKQADLSPELVRKGEDSGGADPAFVRAIEATDWPQGILALLGHDQLRHQYNTFREQRSRRIDERIAAKRPAAKPKQAPPGAADTKVVVRATRPAKPAPGGAT